MDKKKANNKLLLKSLGFIGIAFVLLGIGYTIQFWGEGEMEKRRPAAMEKALQERIYFLKKGDKVILPKGEYPIFGVKTDFSDYREMTKMIVYESCWVDFSAYVPKSQKKLSAIIFLKNSTSVDMGGCYIETQNLQYPKGIIRPY